MILHFRDESARGRGTKSVRADDRSSAPRFAVRWLSLPASALLAVTLGSGCDPEINCTETATCIPMSADATADGDAGHWEAGGNAGASGGTGSAGSAGADASSGHGGAGGSAGANGGGAAGIAGKSGGGAGGSAGDGGGVGGGAGSGGTDGSAGAGGSGGADAGGGGGGLAGWGGAAGSAGSAGAVGGSGGASTGSGGAGASSGSGGAGASSGGGGGADAGDGAVACGADASVGAGIRGPSCSGLAETCGPSANEGCCKALLIPCGTFNRSNDASYPATISAFWMDAYEITVGRFRKFVAAYTQSMIVSGAGKNPNNPSDPGWDTAWNASLPVDAAALASAVQCPSTYQTWTPSAGANESRPINCMTWYEAQAFCIWDGGRLPTEAEWNYAAAGGSDQRIYPWGWTMPDASAQLAIFGCYYGGGTCMGTPANIAPVGTPWQGNGRWGHADLAGNVDEWVQDWYASPYPAGSCDNCANTTAGTTRVSRGADFRSPASDLLTTLRFFDPPDMRTYWLGARCVKIR